MAPISLQAAQDVSVASPLSNAEKNPQLTPYIQGCVVARAGAVVETVDMEKNPQLTPYIQGCTIA
jgi:hypothetical protein